MTPTYTYKRQDDGTTDCYGLVEEGNNYEITCADEFADGIACDIELTTWPSICKYLERNYSAQYGTQIEEIVAC